MKKNFDKADCLLRMMLGSAFVVIGTLYIPWLAIMGAVILLSLLLSCTRLAYRYGINTRKNKDGSHG